MIYFFFACLFIMNSIGLLMRLKDYKKENNFLNKTEMKNQINLYESQYIKGREAPIA